MSDHTPHEPKWRRYLRFWRPDVGADVDDELRFHFQERTEELRARGLSRDEAERVVREEFGDLERARREMREIDERVERRRGRMRWWQHVGQELRHTLRGLRKAPLFAAGVVLTLGLGLGAANTMYGIMRQLLVQPPPHVSAPERLARLYFNYEQVGDPPAPLTIDATSYPYLELVRQEGRGVGIIAAYMADQEVVAGTGGDARVARATLVSGGFWDALGTLPELGRFMTDEEAHPATGARVVVLSHRFWQLRFGGDPGAIGATLHVKGLPYQIIGVAPRGFRGVTLNDTDIWLPLYAEEDGTGRPASWHTFASSSNLRFLVRLPAAGSATTVAAELTRIHQLMLAREETRKQRAHEYTTRVSLAGTTGALGGDGNRMTEGTVAIWVTGVAAVLLLVACANVASLLLLRALHRSREIAIRLALGMSRRRLAAMFLVEGATLTSLGGLAALLVSTWGSAWMRRVPLPGMLGESQGVDGHGMLLLSGLTMLVAVGTGLVPILQMRSVPARQLRDGAQQGSTRRSILYRVLLAAQTTLSTTLLIGAGLFLHSLHHVTTADLGLDADHALLVQIDFTGSGHTERERIAFFERALERVRALPDVDHASLAIGAPLHNARGASISLYPNGEWVTGRTSAWGNYVSDGFFETTGMRITQGRALRPEDRTGDPVVVINETIASMGWPGRSPIGECAYDGKTCARVVGVVKDARSFRIQEDARPWIYFPLDPTDVDSRVLLIRTNRDASAMHGILDRALRELDPALPYVDVRRLGDVLDPQLRPWRLGATVFTAFGILAALLAAFGLYTAVAYAVTQRTREIGVRIAIGASQGSVARLVLGDGLRIAVVGVATGLLLALAGSRWMAELLFETSPREPAVLLVVAGGMLLVSVLASLAPARRAARVQPMEALRTD